MIFCCNCSTNKQLTRKDKMFTKALVDKHSKKVLKDLPGFKIMRLIDFLKLYANEFDEDFETKTIYKKTSYDILCLVDVRENERHTMSPVRRKKFRKFCRQRRDKVKDRYHYCNVFNRIHGFIILDDKTGKINIPRQKKVVSLSLICSSSYSNKKGIGSRLMNFMINICKEQAYSDIILEVAIDYIEDEESDDEESDDEEESDSDVAPELEDINELEEINEEIVIRITREFLRKTLRHTIDNGNTIANYAIDEGYIEEIIYSYMNDYYEEYIEVFTDVDLVEPGEYDYGGYFFQKGVRESPLIKYYEKFGFVEEPEINYVWKVFTPVPYPTMILNLE